MDPNPRRGLNFSFMNPPPMVLVFTFNEEISAMMAE